ncbi:MAG TPA: winged helix-turn-helix domain-containing protein [Pyrinomonadaceae bacterium]|nr:winged helix-turn-helix domain-containing protein [Pyrinomonadaceae bacterium]
MSSSGSEIYEFGPFRLDTGERVLLKDGATVALTPKEAELLTALVRRAGRVVPKEELLREVWADTFVSEKTLAQNVFTLRKALAREDAERQYVETVPRRGYRFGATVREAPAAGGATDAPPTATEAAISFARNDALGSNGSGGRAVGDAAAAAGWGGAPAGGESIEDGGEGLAGEGRKNFESAAGLHVSAATEAGGPHDSAAPRASEAASCVFGLHDTWAPGSGPGGRGGHPVRDAVLIAVVAVLVLGGLIYAVFRFTIRPRTERRPPAFESMKVTRLPVAGEVQEAAISPDGKYLAYVAAGPGEGGAGVWVRQVAAASNAQRIVEPEEGTFYGGLSFTPDGQHVVFAAFGPNGGPGGGGELRQVLALGGAVRRVTGGLGSPVCFSPDGRRIAYTRGHPPGALALYVADADGSNERKVAERQFPSLIGLPAWSPDGRRIAVAYGTGSNADSGNPYIGLAVLDAADGSETRLTAERWVGASKLEWLPDGSGLVLNAPEQELSPAQLWQVSYPSGEVRRVTNDLSSYVGASMTADGSALVAVQTDSNPSVWVAPQSDAARARQITSGAGRFDGLYGVAWAPDGRIVYASVASGNWDIWTMNADGTGQRQLTVGSRSNYGPSVSADGRYIVFLSNRAGAFNIWRMDADGSNPVRLTSGRGENFPHVTPDGRWVVYATYGFQQPGMIWKVPTDGGEPVRLTDKPASWPFVSPDGRFVACVYTGHEGSPQRGRLAVIPIEGGEPVKLFDVAPTFRANVTWTPDNRGLAFLDARSGTNNVWMQPLSGGRPVQLTDFQGNAVIAYDYSRDGRLVATRSAESTGVVLIRDFR